MQKVHGLFSHQHSGGPGRKVRRKDLYRLIFHIPYFSDSREGLLGSGLSSRCCARIHIHTENQVQDGHWLVWKLFILALVSRTWLCCSRAQVLGLCVLRDRLGALLRLGALQIMAHLPWKQESCEDHIKREDRRQLQNGYLSLSDTFFFYMKRSINCIHGFQLYLSPPQKKQLFEEYKK